MRIDLQIPAHLCQQVAADFFLPIFQGRVFFAEVQAAMAALSLVGHKLAIYFPAPRQLLNPPLELGAFMITFSDTCVRTSSENGTPSRPKRGQAFVCRNQAGFSERLAGTHCLRAVLIVWMKYRAPVERVRKDQLHAFFVAGCR